MAIPASLSVFKIDSTSHLTKEFVRKQNQGGGGLQIKTVYRSGDFININGDNFTADNASFINGTVIAGESDADHAVFGSFDGTRSVTTTSSYNLLKGTNLSIKCICGEAYGGSIELPEDPDGDEDIVIEVSTNDESYTRLLGRITERNSSDVEYREYRFLMSEDDGEYYIRITQTDHSGDGYDYFAFKDMRLNTNSSFFDPVNKIVVF
jgi:hypothetical protein